MHHPNVLIQCFRLAPQRRPNFNQLEWTNLFENRSENRNVVSNRAHLTYTLARLHLVQPI